MTYCKTMDEAMMTASREVVEDCLECGKPVDAPLVSYDFIHVGVTVLMHRRCAGLLGQRLVCDAFRNRHADERAERGSPYS